MGLWKRLRIALNAPLSHEQGIPEGAGSVVELPEPEPLSASDREVLDALVAEVKQLRIEWAETLDKVNRWASRQAARQRKELHANLDAAMADEPAAAALPSQPADVKAELRRRFFARRQA